MKVTIGQTGKGHDSLVVEMYDEEALALQQFLATLKTKTAMVSHAERRVLNKLKSQVPNVVKRMRTRYDANRRR